MQFLHALQHWIHLRPVTYVVWASTVLAAAVTVLAIRSGFRRLRRRGDRAPRMIAICGIAILLSLATLAWLDSGQHLPASTPASAQVTQIEFSQSIVAQAQPFSVFGYHAFALALANTAHVLASIPEVRVPAVWTDSRTGADFPDSIVGIPSNLRPYVFMNRTLSPSLDESLALWHHRLNALQPGHVYVDHATYVSNHLEPGDELQLTRKGVVTYWAVQGWFKTDCLVPEHGVIMHLGTAQTLAQQQDQVSQGVLFIGSTNTTYPAAIQNRIRSAASSLPSHKIGLPRTAVRWMRLAKLSADWTRRVAVAALGITCIAMLCLIVLGRKGPQPHSARRDTA